VNRYIAGVSALLLAAGCSHPSHPRAAATTSTSGGVTVPTGATAPGATTTTRVASKPRATTTTSPSSGATGSTLAPGVGAAPLTVHVEKECAQPGGTQTIVIQSTPGNRFAYSTTWGDGQSHTEDYGPHTGWNAGTIPGNGTETDTFTLPPTVATGDARTDVGVFGNDPKKPTGNSASVTWRVALNCG